MYYFFVTYIDFFRNCALTSAAAPKLDIVEAGPQTAREDEKIGISALQIRTARNQKCVSYLSCSKPGQEVLNSRARAEALLEGKLDLSQKGIKVERCLLEKEQEDLEGKKYLILICSFSPGSFSPFASLSEEECRSFGQGVGSLHSLGAGFEGFLSFSAPSIRFELDSWIKRLRESGKVDSRILDAWEELSEMDALWDFSPSLIHGGWKKGQAGFAGGALCSFSKWEEAQISDPARDLEWMFSEKMEQKQIDAFMQGYVMSMNDSMDPFILPRAKLWRQMKMGAALLEAQGKGEEQAAFSLSRQLLRLSSELRSITPQKPQGSLPLEVLAEPLREKRGVKDLEEGPSLHPVSPSPAPAATSATSRLSSPDEKADGEEIVKEAEEIEEEKVEEEFPGDPALKSAMWRVVVRAAMAKREGRDLKAELEAEKKLEEQKAPEDRDTAIFKQADYPPSASSIPTTVRIKDGGSAKERAKGAPAGPSRFTSPSSLPNPPKTQHAESQSQTKVINRIDGNANE